MTPRSPSTQGLLAVIRTTIVPVDVGIAPQETNTPAQIAFPYAVLHPITAQVLGGALSNPFGHVMFHYDLWAVGRQLDQAEAAMDVMLTAITGPAQVAWPAGAAFLPAPSERSLVGWGPSFVADDRRLAWVSAEVGLAVLT